MAAPKHAAKKHKKIGAHSHRSWRFPAVMRLTWQRGHSARRLEIPATVRRARRPVILGGVLVLASVITLTLTALPSAGKGRDSLARTMSLSGEESLEIKGVSLAERAIEQKYQIHMEETTAQAGDIPYEDVWALNDPFFPLIGDPGTLSDDTGTLDSKLAHILGRPVPQTPATVQLDAGGNPITGTTPGPTGTTGITGTTVGTTSMQSGNVLLVEQITESRGIMYARIKVGSQVYDNIRAGTAFADIYEIAEFKDYQTVVILCGDERYELQVGQLRRI